MKGSLHSRERINVSKSKEFYQRRVVVRYGFVETVTLSRQTGDGILRVWLPKSIVFLKADKQVQSILQGVPPFVSISRWEDDST
jgi:hypothetical protein